MYDHVYSPHAATGRCIYCPTPVARRHVCQWCGHERGHHDGRVPAEVRAHYRIGTRNGRPVYLVPFSTTACGMPHCACKKYES